MFNSPENCLLFQSFYLLLIRFSLKIQPRLINEPMNYKETYWLHMVFIFVFKKFHSECRILVAMAMKENILFLGDGMFKRFAKIGEV